MTTHTQLSAPEAQMLTDRAVKLADELARTLVAIHDGNGHKALGYKTWTAFCEAHFDTPLRTIYRMMRQERVRIVLEGHANLARFTGEALEALATVPPEMMRYVAEVAATADIKEVDEINVRAVQIAIHDTLTLNAVTLADGSQVSVKEALVDGVRGTLREATLTQRDYVVACAPGNIGSISGLNEMEFAITVYVDSGHVKWSEIAALIEAKKPVHISIWREE
jgi:hypothetical protein